MLNRSYNFAGTFSPGAGRCVGLSCLGLCFGGVLLTAVPPKEAQDYALVFSEDFKTLDLGSAQAPISPQAHRWYEGVWFSHEHAPLDRFTVANSELSMTWKRGQREPDSSISTFSASGRGYRAWRYGYFEARMKWKPVKGAWPAFWLISVPRGSGKPPEESGEIDIFEGQGDEPQTFFGTIHRWSDSRSLASSADRNKFSLPPNTDFADYHTYGLLWVPGRVTWFFDGIPLHSERTYALFDREEFFIALGMQEGTDWETGDLSGVSARSLTLVVNWVRIWQRKTIAGRATT